MERAIPPLITRKTPIPEYMTDLAPAGQGDFFEGSRIDVFEVSNVPWLPAVLRIQLRDDVLRRINEFIKPEKSGGYRTKSQDWERAIVPLKLISVVDGAHVAIFTRIGEYLEIPDEAKPEMCAPQNGFGGFHTDPYGCMANMVLHKPQTPDDKLRSVVTVFGNKDLDSRPQNNDLSDCCSIGLYPNDALLFSTRAPHAAAFYDDIGLTSSEEEVFGEDSGAYLLDLNPDPEEQA